MRKKDFDTIMDSANELNKKYGGNFGYKVIIYTVIASIIFIILVFGIQHTIKRKISNETFNLDSESKYIISIQTTNFFTYYEVDFSKNLIIKRHDTNAFKREELKRIKVLSNELEPLLKEITSDENNLILTTEDRENLHKQHCHHLYKVKSYDQKEYYIKNVSQIKHLKQLLNEDSVNI